MCSKSCERILNFDRCLPLSKLRKRKRRNFFFSLVDGTSSSKAIALSQNVPAKFSKRPIFTGYLLDTHPEHRQNTDYFALIDAER